MPLPRALNLPVLTKRTWHGSVTHWNSPSTPQPCPSPLSPHFCTAALPTHLLPCTLLGSAGTNLAPVTETTAKQQSL